MTLSNNSEIDFYGHIYVGVDWADGRHNVYVTDDTACVLDSFAILHNYEGMEELRKHLARFSATPESPLVTAESH